MCVSIDEDPPLPFPLEVAERVVVVGSLRRRLLCLHLRRHLAVVDGGQDVRAPATMTLH
jgi:hypothetical protein